MNYREPTTVGLSITEEADALWRGDLSARGRAWKEFGVDTREAYVRLRRAGLVRDEGRDEP